MQMKALGVFAAGMSTNLEIVTGKRRVIEYLWSPVARAVHESGGNVEESAEKALSNTYETGRWSIMNNIKLCCACFPNMSRIFVKAFVCSIIAAVLFNLMSQSVSAEESDARLPANLNILKPQNFDTTTCHVALNEETRRAATKWRGSETEFYDRYIYPAEKQAEKKANRSLVQPNVSAGGHHTQRPRPGREAPSTFGSKPIPTLRRLRRP